MVNCGFDSFKDGLATGMDMHISLSGVFMLPLVVNTLLLPLLQLKLLLLLLLLLFILAML
jgi:hypothetical protein